MFEMPMFDIPMHNTASWYPTIMTYARKNYEMGWDFFVEGVDLIDFETTIREQKLSCFEEVFDFYAQKTVDRLEAMQEARGDCDWDDEQADADALASAGWGTDEDYGHYGGDE